MSCYIHTSSQSSDLPGEEFRRLQKLQVRERLSQHFEHKGCPSTSWHHSKPHRDAELSYEDRYRSSEIRYATRAALGPNFDFNDTDCEQSVPRRDKYEQDHGWTSEGLHEGHIPQKYLDEFNQRWHEDDEDHDADRFIADHMTHAPWRQPAHLDHHALPSHIIRTHQPAASSGRHDSAVDLTDYSSSRATVARPHLKSHFSFEEEAGKESRLFNRSRG